MDIDRNVTRLKIFHTVARRLSFTRASEELNLTQPGISKHIKELEGYYGTRLFDRLGKKVVLTQAGEILLEATVAIFGLIDGSKARIDDLNGLSGGRLSLGATTTIGTYILPEMLVRFRKRYPGIGIRVEITLSRQVVGKVLDNSLELGFVGHYGEHKGLVARPFLSDPMVLIVSPNHAWARRRSSVRLRELADQPFLWSQQGSGTWRFVSDLLDRAGVTLGKTMELGTTEAVKHAVAADLGVSIVSGHVLSGEAAVGRIKSIPLAGVEPRRDFFLLRARGGYLSEASRAFLTLNGIDP